MHVGNVTVQYPVMVYRDEGTGGMADWGGEGEGRSGWVDCRMMETCKIKDRKLQRKQ